MDDNNRRQVDDSSDSLADDLEDDLRLRERYHEAITADLNTSTSTDSDNISVRHNYEDTSNSSSRSSSPNVLDANPDQVNSPEAIDRFRSPVSQSTPLSLSIDDQIHSDDIFHNGNGNNSANGNDFSNENDSTNGNDFDGLSISENEIMQAPWIIDGLRGLDEDSTITDDDQSPHPSSINTSGDSRLEFNFPKLMEFLRTEENNEFIDARIQVTAAEVLLAILKFSMTYNLTQTAIADLFKMFNIFFGFSELPSSRYLIDQMFNTDLSTEYHAVCPTCKQYVSIFQRTQVTVRCLNCEEDINLKDPTYTDFFAIIDVRNEIANLIENNSLHYDNIVRQQVHDDVFNDITDGVHYRRFVNSLTPDNRYNYATAVFNSDGSPTFESSKFSIWPIQLIINELPINIRVSKSITCAIWFGKDKPDMQIFLKPFVNHINDLSQNGVKCKINNVNRSIKIYALCCCVDSVARAPMQGLKQYNGYFGCNWCLHPGVYVASNRGGVGGSVKYVLLEDVPASRTEIATYRHMQQSLTSAGAIYGVKNPSWLINLSSFNIISGFVPDNMHSVSLGIAEQFMSYWIDSTQMEYSFSALEITEINIIMKNLKVPNQILRLSRSIKDRKFWKAKEYENWILYYSLIILLCFEHLNEVALHWSYLIEGFYLLLQTSVSRIHINEALENFKIFLHGTERIYGRSAMTFNIHQLLHLPQSVADWGPLWSHSGYVFENGNGILQKKIHAAKGVVHQICRSVAMNQCEIVLKKHFENNEDSAVLNYVNYLENKVTNNTLKITHVRYFGYFKRTVARWIRELNLSDYSRTYRKIVKNRCLYTSSMSERVRSDNSYAITTNGTYIRLIDFIVDRNTRSEFTICNELNVQNLFDRPLLPNKRVNAISEELTAIDTNDIDRVCVFIQIRNSMFICAVPNLYFD